MSTTTFTSGGHRRKHLKNCYAPHLLEVDYIKDLLFSQQCTFSSPSQHSLQILSSLLPFTRNLPSTRRPNCCIVLWQQPICWLVLFLSHSILLIGCPWFRNTGAFVDTHLMQPASLCGEVLIIPQHTSIDFRPTYKLVCSLQY